MGKLSFLRRSNIALMAVAFATFVSAKAFGGLVEIPIASAATETVTEPATIETKPIAAAEPMSEVASVDDAIPPMVTSANSALQGLIFASMLPASTPHVVAVVEPNIPPAVAAPLPAALVPGIMLIAASFGLTKKRRLV